MTMTLPARPTDKPSVFISGSISIRHLPAEVSTRLLAIIDRGLPVLIGDARGVDNAAQRLLADHDALDVTVFCAGGFPRNNVGDWDVRNIPGEGRAGTAAFHAGKDRAMAVAADMGLVIWDGDSRGVSPTSIGCARVAASSRCGWTASGGSKTSIRMKRVRRSSHAIPADPFER